MANAELFPVAEALQLQQELAAQSAFFIERIVEQKDCKRFMPVKPVTVHSS